MEELKSVYKQHFRVFTKSCNEFDQKEHIYEEKIVE